MKVYELFFRSQQHVSLSTTAMAALPALTQGQWPSFLTLFTVYALTSLAYILERLIPQKEDELTKKDRRQWFQLHQKALILYLLLLAFYLVYFSCKKATIESLALCFFLGLLTLTYIIPSQGIKNAKKILGGKDILVAFVWTSCCLIFPVLQDQLQWTVTLSLCFIQCLIISLVNCFLFDLRDRESDQKEEIQSLVLCWGKEKTQLWIFRLLLLNSLISLFLPSALIMAFLPLNILSFILSRKREINYRLLDCILAWPAISLWLLHCF